MRCCIDMSHVLLYGYEPCVVVPVMCCCMSNVPCVVVWVMCCCMDMGQVLLYGSCVVVWI